MNATNLPPGPDLDRLVAERVMGFSPYTHVGVYLDENRKIRNTGEYANRSQYWSPSTNIAHAWEVMEKMKGHSPLWFNLISGFSTIPGFDNLRSEDDGLYIHSMSMIMARQPRAAPLAICRAALLAVDNLDCQDK